MTADHLIPLGTDGWGVWPDALLRSAGFPVEGLDALRMPACAAAADGVLNGTGSEADFEGVFEAATVATAHALHDVAADPRFREAVSWQNPAAAATIDGIVRDGPDARRNERRRRREDLVGRYWQRYCLKNDTIGFYGPMAWVQLDAVGSGFDLSVGAAVERDRFAVLERWAVDGVAQALAADPEVRPWLPVAVPPHLFLIDEPAGAELRHPSRPPLRLTGPEAAVLARCDGTAPAARVAADLVAAGDFRDPADVLAVMDRLVERDALRWGLDLPWSVGALAGLGAAVRDIPDGSGQDTAAAAYEALVALRAGLAAAAGPEQVRAAIGALDAHVERVTGAAAQRGEGQTYVGRTTCHVEATRDVDLRVGRVVLDRIAAPLGPLLAGARWLTARTAQVYGGLLADLHADLAQGRPEPVPFAELWFLALGSIFGASRPVDRVVDEFVAGWSTVFGLADLPAGTSQVQLTATELAERVALQFPAARPGWTEAAIHSPDLHLLADSAEAIAAGDFTVVLGEVHIGFPAFDTSFFLLGHPEPDRLTDFTRADFPGGRVLPVFPADWPRNTARNGRAFDGGADVHLGFVAAPGVDPERLLPVTALTVADGPGGLVARAPDGRTWPLIEMFAGLVGLHVFDAWKLTGSSGHTPRITVDDMVLARESWRLTAGETGLADVVGERPRYLAGRALRDRLGLPERVFVRVATEIKPFYVDFTSPLYVKALCTTIRAAVAAEGPDVGVSLAELLPGPEHAWLPDAAGRRYCSELRLQVLDPVPARRA